MTTVEHRVSRLEGGYDHLATKADIAEVRTELAELRAELKADAAELRAELKSDIAAVQNGQSEMKAELIKWMAGWTLGGMAAISAVVIAMLRFLG